jgi:DDE superfamily endonuclease
MLDLTRFQIRIRVEHTIGLLKGTFQSLKEIRIQLLDNKRHKIIIMWARVCIILHNLIIRIEGDDFDEEWREAISRAGSSDDDDMDEDDGLDNAGLEDVLEQAERRLETPGQRFRLRLMDRLLHSPSYLVERRP